MHSDDRYMHSIIQIIYALIIFSLQQCKIEYANSHIQLYFKYNLWWVFNGRWPCLESILQQKNRNQFWLIANPVFQACLFICNIRDILMSRWAPNEEAMPIANANQSSIPQE